MEYYYPSHLQKERHVRRLGLEMQELEVAIYSGRQTLKALRVQEPRDDEAISTNYQQIREAHGQHHVVARQLDEAKATDVDVLWAAIKPWR